MSLASKNILEIPVTISPKKDILEEIRRYLFKNSKFEIRNSKTEKNSIDPFVIFTPNPEIIEYSQGDFEFKKILTTSEINLPDGEGIIWAINHIYKEKITRIPGADFMLDLCDLAQKGNVVVGLIGGKKGIALRSAKCLDKKFPGLKSEIFEVGDLPRHPELVSGFSEKQKQMLKRVQHDVIHWIETKQISILFVALGFPKQEYFIKLISEKAKKRKREKPLVLMAVGGSFDYISGQVRRAPVWIRENKMEWLYRLLQEPSRIGRQLKGAGFFWRVIKDK